MVSRGTGRSIDVEATAYTLGGNTAMGFDLTGLSREDAMVIAVDPDVIPLGSQVYITFDDAWSEYNGVYTASDTGGAINGNIVDVFVGHGNDSEAMSFGRRSATIEFL
jgi:3D (Asp-Asp-Asp) domain-containing protein